MNEPSIKGAAFRELILWYGRSWDGGRERLQSIVADLPPRLATLVRPNEPALGLLASTWYPSALCNTMLDGVCAGLSPAVRARMVREGTEAVATTLLRGLYKWLFAMLASPERYARYIGRGWRQLHSTGERYMAITGPGRAESAILDWDGHHPVLCEITTETMSVLFTQMGCKQVRTTRTACVSSGAADCRTMLCWEPATRARTP
ncbi:MAG: hypothetical protein IT379_27130 [Deltaproteobacteria bacterium]|nr:hypothetical protein [Deltaproteobacteria bacterium]